MPSWVMTALNLWSFTVGTVGFCLAYARRDHSKDHPEQIAGAFFVFMMCAMWGAEVFYLVSIGFRLAGHPWVVPR